MQDPRTFMLQHGLSLSDELKTMLINDLTDSERHDLDNLCTSIKDDLVLELAMTIKLQQKLIQGLKEDDDSTISTDFEEEEAYYQTN